MPSRSSHQQPPPADIARFPSQRWYAGREFYRAAGKHANGTWQSPWWFCTCGDCRFDLPTGSAIGTLYAATNPVSAIVEYLGFDAGALVNAAMLRKRRVCTLHYDLGFPLALPAHPRAASFGATAELTSSPDYEVPQAWAAAFAAAGFDGIWYQARFAVNSKPTSLAMFDAAGAQERWPIVDSVSAQDQSLVLGLQAIGIDVSRAPRLADLDVIG